MLIEIIIRAPINQNAQRRRVLAQPLLFRNWIAGFLNLRSFIPFCFLRVRTAEQRMLEQFGDQYRTYMQKVGAVFPRF